MAEKILTLHPDPGKKGTSIAKAKYDQMRAAIVAELCAQGEQTFRVLQSKIDEKLAGMVEGSIGWYYVTVKLDLEARGIIERVPGSSPQILRLKE